MFIMLCKGVHKGVIKYCVKMTIKGCMHQHGAIHSLTGYPLIVILILKGPCVMFLRYLLNQ